MTLLVLNRRQILSRIPDWLRDIDDDLVVITARSAVPRGRADGIAGYRQLVVVDDNAYNDASTGNLIVEVARKFRVDRILSTAEVDVVRTAKARAILSLKGQTLASAVAYRNKYKMKSIAGAAGIEVAPMAIVRCAYDMVSFAEVYGLPFVLKPLDGGGSAGVRVIRNHHDIAQVAWNVENDKSQYLLAEAWLEGDFFTVDGLMASGQVLQQWPSWTSPNLTTVAEGHPLLSWMLPTNSSLRGRINCFVAKVIAVLPGPADITAFHAEVFRTRDDRLVLCEIACRPGGCGHVPVYQKALGVNLYEASLRGQAGCTAPPTDNTNAPRSMGGFIWFPPIKAKLLALPSECPIDGTYGYIATANPGSWYSGAKGVGDHIARVFVSGPSDRTVEPIVRNVAKWWDMTCQWELDQSRPQAIAD